jgi:mono/diheme cytochrome c family protein
VRRCVWALGMIAVLSGTAANSENLDEGKSGPRLFADSCVTCHRSPQGLAKGRFSLTLYMFLQQHYVSNSSAAKELTSYLESVDIAPGGGRGQKAKPPRRATGASGVSAPLAAGH